MNAIGRKQTTPSGTLIAMAWIGVPLTTPRRTVALLSANDAADRIAKMAPSTGGFAFAISRRGFGLRGEEIPQPLAHRVGGLRRPFAEALAGAHAELAGATLSLMSCVGSVERSRSASSMFWMSSVRSTPTRSVCSIGPSTAIRAPKPLLTTSSMVSASQTPDAISAIASRLSACCSRLPTKPGMSFFTCTGLRPASRNSAMVLAHGLVAGLFVLRDLDQRHEMRRIPEMRADHALAMLELLADPRRGNGRAVAGEDRRRARSGLRARRRAAA